MISTVPFLSSEHLRFSLSLRHSHSLALPPSSSPSPLSPVCWIRPLTGTLYFASRSVYLLGCSIWPFWRRLRCQSTNQRCHYCGGSHLPFGTRVLFGSPLWALFLLPLGAGTAVRGSAVYNSIAWIVGRRVTRLRPLVSIYTKGRVPISREKQY